MPDSAANIITDFPVLSLSWMSAPFSDSTRTDSTEPEPAANIITDFPVLSLPWMSAPFSDNRIISCEGGRRGEKKVPNKAKKKIEQVGLKCCLVEVGGFRSAQWVKAPWAASYKAAPAFETAAGALRTASCAFS